MVIIADEPIVMERTQEARKKIRVRNLTSMNGSGIRGTAQQAECCGPVTTLKPEPFGRPQDLVRCDRMSKGESVSGVGCGSRFNVIDIRVTLRARDQSILTDHSKKPLHPAVEFHDCLASSWSLSYHLPALQERMRVVRSMISKLRVDGQIWLDAGCGSGDLSTVLLDQGASILCADAAPGMLEEAREKIHQYPHRAQLLQVRTISELPLPSQSLDGVLCSSVLEYVDDLPSTLRELVRVLKPEGALVVSMPNRRSLLRRLHKLAYFCTRLIGQPLPQYIEFSLNETEESHFKGILENLGLRPLDNRPFGAPHLAPLGNLTILQPLLFFLALKGSPSNRHP